MKNHRFTATHSPISLLPVTTNPTRILLSDTSPTFAPVDPYAIEKELRQVQALMKLEQQEDLEIGRAHV